MTINNHLKGKKGENIAINYLLKNGYTILNRNWHFQHKEIDIIALKNDEIIFFEVKYRENLSRFKPEESITDKKQKFLIEAADAYIQINKIFLPARFDVICIVNNKIIKHYINAINP